MYDDRTIVDCARCNGTGKVKHAPGLGIHYEWVTCPACKRLWKTKSLS